MTRVHKSPYCAYPSFSMIFTELEMTTTYEDRKEMFELMKMLVKPEQEEIYRIIRRFKETYTENSNGIFFDLSSLSDQAYSSIKEYLEFCLKTRQEMNVRIEEMERIRIEQHPI
jgi:hypothetical protein